MPAAFGRRTAGLPETRRRQWLLPIDFEKRETFTFDRERYSRILELGKAPPDRRRLLDVLNQRPACRRDIDASGNDTTGKCPGDKCLAWDHAGEREARKGSCERDRFRHGAKRSWNRSCLALLGARPMWC